MARRSADGFRCLCDCLSAPENEPRLLELRGRWVRAPEVWRDAIRVAGRYFLVPALWAALERKGWTDLLPEDARHFLCEAHRLNRARNERLRAQALELAQELGRAGIQPIMLKGGAYLFEGYPEAFATRMMKDLDVLVPTEAFRDAVETTRRLGYEVIREQQQWAHDYHTLGRSGGEASLEMHRDIVEHRELLPVPEAVRGAVPLEESASPVYALSPTHRVLHNVFHTQIQDRALQLGIRHLRGYFDLWLLRQRHGTAIDWGFVSQRLDRFGYERALRTQLYLANRLLGYPLPAGFEPTLRDRLHYRRCAMQARSRWLTTLVRAWGTLTHPLVRSRIEYIHGIAPNRLVLSWWRLRRAVYLLWKYRTRLGAKTAEIYRRV